MREWETFVFHVAQQPRDERMSAAAWTIYSVYIQNTGTLVLRTPCLNDEEAGARGGGQHTVITHVKCLLRNCINDKTVGLELLL